MAKQADVRPVCVGFNQHPAGQRGDRRSGLSEGEGRDRTFELPAGQSNLISAVAAANPQTVWL